MSSHSHNLSFHKAKGLLQEGDVLLFKGQGMFSRAIKVAGEGHYSHAAVVSGHRTNGSIFWECVEFREWKGGRTVSLESQIAEHDGLIDVYRAAPHFMELKYEDDKVIGSRIALDGKCITNHMRSMTGLPYGWKRIWWIAKNKLPVLRWFYDVESVTDDKHRDLVYPVCSTAVAYSYSKCGYDLIPNRADQWTEPNDLARSALLNYLFTLTT